MTCEGGVCTLAPRIQHGAAGNYFFPEVVCGLLPPPKSHPLSFSVCPAIFGGPLLLGPDPPRPPSDPGARGLAGARGSGRAARISSQATRLRCEVRPVPLAWFWRGGPLQWANPARRFSRELSLPKQTFETNLACLL